MKRTDKANIILDEIDAAYSIPSYLEADVIEAIVKALVIIEKREGKEVETT